MPIKIPNALPATEVLEGENIFVIKNIAPDIPLSDIIWGTMPFVILMFLAVLLCCFVPGIATWLPSIVMK